MGRRWLAPLVVITVVVALGPSAQARDGHYDGKVATTTVVGGATTVTSATLPDDVRSTDIYMNNDATRTQEDFKVMVFTLMKVKTKKNRLVACAAFAADQMDVTRELLYGSTIDPTRIESFAGNRGAAYALMCMNIARLMAEIESEGAPPARKTARRSSCDVVPIQVKVRVERTDDEQVHLVPHGRYANGAKTLPVRTTCSGRGAHLNLRVTPKKRGPLKRAVGPRVIVGVANPPAAARDAKVTVGFKGH